jgi:putative two-component system response regulator
LKMVKDPPNRREHRTVPRRALGMSIAALAVPLVSVGLVPDVTGEELGLLVWISALIPGFLLSYYRGWSGSAIALAAGMVLIALSSAVLSLRGLPLPSPGMTVLLVGGYLAVSFGLGLVTELLHRERRVAQEQALTDALTGLPNRRHAEVFLDAAMNAARVNGAPLSVVIFDLDHFKWLNDTHGHAAGDDVLKAFAGILLSSQNPRWLFARVGGEEFLAILTNTPLAEAVDFAERIRMALSMLDLRWQPITASAGVAELQGNRQARELLEAADGALYQAKESGRDRVEIAGHSRREAPSTPGTLSPEPSSPPSGRGLIVLPDPSARKSVRRILELNGLRVEEYASPAEVPIQLDRGQGPVAVLISGAETAPGCLHALATLRTVVSAEVPRVMFVREGEAAFPVHPEDHDDLTFVGWPPSGDRLLPVLSGILTRPIVHGIERSEATLGHVSRLSGEDVPLTEGLVVVVDDERSNRVALRRTLEDIGFKRIAVVEDGARALEAIVSERPDLLILDLHMPGMDGFGVLEALRGPVGGDPFLPVLVVTGDKQWELRQRALSMGAKDFLNKPFDVSELGARVLNLLETRRLHLRMQELNHLLERRVWSRTRELGRAKDEILFRLAQAAEYRDDVTGKHAERVGAAAAILADTLGLSPGQCDILRRAAPLHDVGKIAIPDAILLKKGPLTPEEREVMESHTTIGAQLLTESTSDIIEAARVIALTHHERWDGNGYPNRLSGARIPIEGQIVAVVDALDALTHTRPYKSSMPYDDAETRLLADFGTAFAPELMDVLVRARSRLIVVMSEGT